MLDADATEMVCGTVADRRTLIAVRMLQRADSTDSALRWGRMYFGYWVVGIAVLRERQCNQEMLNLLDRMQMKDAVRRAECKQRCWCWSWLQWWRQETAVQMGQ